MLLGKPTRALAAMLLTLTTGLAHADTDTLQAQVDAIGDTAVVGVLASSTTGAGSHGARAGVADISTGAPVPLDAEFRIGSVTKTFVATVVLQLVGEGRLSLDDTVARWLPGVVNGNGNDGAAITIRELLQHTSGLHNYTDDLQAQITSVKAYRKLEFHQFSRMDLLKIALAHKQYFAPGTGWHYSNTNYILLGMIIEKVTHRPWASVVARRIAGPLGLHHTFAPGNSVRLPRPHATGYLFFSRNVRIDTTAENMSWARSAGGLISNAADLTRFWQAIGHGTLLAPAQRREMERTVPADAGDAASVPGSRYGLGIFRIPLTCGGFYWSHEGDVPGYNTIGAVSADGRKTVVLSLDSNVENPQLAAEYGLVDHVMCSK